MPLSPTNSAHSSSSSFLSDPIKLVLDRFRNSFSKKPNQSRDHGCSTTWRTNSINSSHYVDFCTDPTRGFAFGGIDDDVESCRAPYKEARPIPSQVQVPPPAPVFPSTSNRSNSMEFSSSSSRTTDKVLQTSKDSIEILPFPDTAMIRNTMTVLPVRLGQPTAPVAVDPATTSSHLRALRTWEWPRHAKPPKHYSTESEEEYKSNNLFHESGRHAKNPSGNPRRLLSCLPEIPASLSPLPSGTSLHSTSMSSSSSTTTSSTDSVLQPCQVHNNPFSTYSEYYRYSSSATPSIANHSAQGFCDRGSKFSTRPQEWSSNYDAAFVKGHNLRTFQLICALLCALAIATLLVTSIISASIRPPPAATSTFLVPQGANDLDIYYDTSISSIPQDETHIQHIHHNLPMQDQLKAWLFRNASDPLLALPLSASTLEASALSLLNISHFKYILNSPEICNHNNHNRSAEIHFLIAVHSAPTNFQQRQAIRSTWGSVKSIQGKTIRLVFLLGQFPVPAGSPDLVRFTTEPVHNELQRSIAAEHQLYGDIVQGNFDDVYHNLIYKHLMGYKWIMRHCNNGQVPTFVLKTDDDVFIDIFQLFEFTTKTYGIHPTGTIICNVYEGTSPVRESNVTVQENPGLRKWVVSNAEYPLQRYPKYCGGLAYLITPDVISRLIEANEKIMLDLRRAGRTLQFWIDDVYVTGVLRELIGKEPYYLNLRYAYDTKLYKPWLQSPEEAGEYYRGTSNGNGSTAATGASTKSSRYLVDVPTLGEQGLHKEQQHHHQQHRIPYMIVHLEHKNVLTEEMNSLWRKTMRVWRQ